MIASRTQTWVPMALASGQMRASLFCLRTGRLAKYKFSIFPPSELLPQGRSWSSPSSFQSRYSTVVVHSRSHQRTRRFVSGLILSTISFATGACLALEYFRPFLVPFVMGSVLTDSDSLSSYKAPDEYCQKIDQYINNCSLAQELRTFSEFTESRPHQKIPEAIRAHNLTGGTLAGPGMITVPPYVWTAKESNTLISIFHVGNNVSGHPGMVHGGLLATMLDEGLARACFSALPNKVGFTAYLKINYKQPTKTDQYLVLVAKTTQVQGRKASVEGHIETVPEDGQDPEILVTANALFVEPRAASMFKSLYKGA